MERYELRSSRDRALSNAFRFVHEYEYRGGWPKVRNNIKSRMNAYSGGVIITLFNPTLS